MYLPLDTMSTMQLPRDGASEVRLEGRPLLGSGRGGAGRGGQQCPEVRLGVWERAACPVCHTDSSFHALTDILSTPPTSGCSRCPWPLRACSPPARCPCVSVPRQDRVGAQSTPPPGPGTWRRDVSLHLLVRSERNVAGEKATGRGYHVLGGGVTSHSGPFPLLRQHRATAQFANGGMGESFVSV